MLPLTDRCYFQVVSRLRLPLCRQSLPVNVQVLWGECISGALYLGDFKSMAKSAGFADPRILTTTPIEVNDTAMRKLLGPTKFYSITARLFKLPEMLEPDCEDYGQVATYKVGPWEVGRMY
jgi:arsenite methyltransferase